MVVTFKERLRSGDPLVGTFLKTPSAMICEVLGRSDLDAVCIDAEHSPFDRRDINNCVLALQSVGKPSLVRLPSNRPEHILNALDCGATGIVAPHVIKPEDAKQLADDAHFGRGRGYAGSTRAAGYGAKKMADHKRISAGQTTIIAQIEDADALNHLGGLFSEDRIDSFFIGRADLSVSLGADGPNDPEVIEAVEEICRVGHEAGVAVGMFTANIDEIPKWRRLGASLFLLGSDHGFMLNSAAKLTETVRAAF